MALTSHVVWEEKRGQQGRVLPWEGGIVLLLVLTFHGGLIVSLSQAERITPPLISPQSMVGVLIAPSPTPKPTAVTPAPPLKREQPKEPPPIKKPQIKPKPVVTPEPKTPTVAKVEPAQPMEDPVEVIPPTPSTPISQETTPVTEATPPSPIQSAAIETPEIVLPKVDAAHANNPAPRYPPLSRRLGEEGEVQLLVHILEDGSVAEVKLKTSSGHSRLDKAAMTTIARWRYLPAHQEGKPIAYWYVQPVAFFLNNH